MRREEYENEMLRDNDQGGNDEAASGGAPRLLPANALGGRRIIKVNRPTRVSGNASVASVGSSSSSKPNIFANVRLTTDHPQPAPNNSFFASSKFPSMSSNGGTATVPKSNATASPLPTSMFGAKATNPTPTMTTKSVRPQSFPNQFKNTELSRFSLEQDKEFLEKFIEGYPSYVDQMSTLWEYGFFRMLKENRLQNKDNDISGKSNATITTSHVSTKATTPSSSHTLPAPSFGTSKPFTFSNSSSISPLSEAPPAAASSNVNPFSFTGPTKPSFTADSATTSHKGGFVFGPSGTNSLSSYSKDTGPGPSPVGEAPTNADSGFLVDSQDDHDKVRKTEDPDWNEVQSFPSVRIYHQENISDPSSEWKSFASGELHIQAHKKNAKEQRIVMRNEGGTTVLVNMKISDYMQFRIKIETSKKNKTFGVIDFRGMNDSERGMESFKIKAQEQTARTLCELLESIAKAASLS